MRFQNCSGWQLFPSLSLLFVTLSYYSRGHIFVCFSKSNFFAGTKFNNGLTTNNGDGGGEGVDATPSEGVKEREKIKLSYIQAFMSF